MVKRFLLQGTMWSLASCLVCMSAMAQQTLWQIGHFDDNSREFHDSFGVPYANPSSDVDFTVGRSTDKDWLRFQPGPANGLAGGREHPFRIHFRLDDKPSGTYTLKVAVLYETPRKSSLQLDINGHRGLFFFHPTLDYAAGDWEGTFVPQTSRAERDINIPADWLRAGENTFTLTAVDTPSKPVSALGDIAPGISGIVYDALSLEHSAKAALTTTSLTANATIFFRAAGSQLRESVAVCADVPGGQQVPDTIELKAGAFQERHSVASGEEFGDFCSEYDVPEWKGDLAATVAAAGTTSSITLHAQRKWTIDIVPHEHLDVGFTDYRAKVAELQSQSLDGVLNILPAHPDFRWTMDGSWVAEQFIAGRSPLQIDRLMQAIRAGQIVLPAQFANQHTGVASLEGLARSLYPSHDIALRYKVPVGAANITDVPSYSWSYASLLHDAGVQYFAAASNSWRAPIMLLGRWNEKSPFYWEGPDGGRVLMWYSRAYLQAASMFGVSPQVEAVHDALPVFLQAYTRSDYRADSVILFGSQLENTVLDKGQVSLPARWAALYAYPKLEFSTFQGAMQKLQSQFGEENIKTYRGDFGPYWEDGFASGSDATAQHRANQQRIVTAEQMAALPSLLNPTLRPDAGKLNDAWHNMLLFDEHTWTSVSATTAPESDESRLQLALKKAEATDGANDIEQSIQRSWAQLESFLAPIQNSVAVFNSLAWTRSGWLDIDLPEGQQVVDPDTKRPVPQERERIETGIQLPGFGGATARVRFEATNVPAAGYKLFSLQAGSAAAAPAPLAPDTCVLENKYYRVALDPGTAGISSIWDKTLKVELVDASSPFRLGSYVYVTGGDDIPNNSLYRYGAGLPQPVLSPHIAERGRIVSVTRSARGETAVLEASALNTPSIRSEIVLPDDARRIDIRIDLDKVATLHREAAYIAFPFRVASPSFAYDTQNGWVDPARDELAGGSREWYATQHWAAVHNSSMSVAVVPLDAPLVNFGDIVHGTWPSQFTPKSSAIFSWIMSNYWNTNFASEQGGHFTFRYSLFSSDNFNASALARLSEEQMTPLESDSLAASTSRAVLPSGQASFLSLDNPDIAISTWKRAADGDGSILRLVEIGGKQSTVHVATPQLELKRAWRCSLLESCEEEVPVKNGEIQIAAKPYEILTLKLVTRPRRLAEAQP